MRRADVLGSQALEELGTQGVKVPAQVLAAMCCQRANARQHRRKGVSAYPASIGRPVVIVCLPGQSTMEAVRLEVDEHGGAAEPLGRAALDLSCLWGPQSGRAQGALYRRRRRRIHGGRRT